MISAFLLLLLLAIAPQWLNLHRLYLDGLGASSLHAGDQLLRLHGMLLNQAEQRAFWAGYRRYLWKKLFLWKRPGSCSTLDCHLEAALGPYGRSRFRQWTR